MLERLMWCARCGAELWEPLTTDPEAMLVCERCVSADPPPAEKPLMPEQVRRIRDLLHPFRRG